MVERFNGRIEEVLQSHHFRSGEELETTLHRYVWLYNQKRPSISPGLKTVIRCACPRQRSGWSAPAAFPRHLLSGGAV